MVSAEPLAEPASASLQLCSEGDHYTLIKPLQSLLSTTSQLSSWSLGLAGLCSTPSPPATAIHTPPLRAGVPMAPRSLHTPPPAPNRAPAPPLPTPLHHLLCMYPVVVLFIPFPKEKTNPIKSKGFLFYLFIFSPPPCCLINHFPEAI